MLYLGSAVIVIGALLLLERMEIIEGSISTYWPVLLIAIGLAMVISWWRDPD